MDASNEMIVSTQNGVTISHVGGDNGDHHHYHHHHHHHNEDDDHHNHHNEEDDEDDINEDEDSMDQFDDDVPAHRRMTVTRVTDHAELADSVLSAQSAPTINISPLSPTLLPPSRAIVTIEQNPIKREETV